MAIRPRLGLGNGGDVRLEGRRLGLARSAGRATGRWLDRSPPIIVANPRGDAAFRFLIGIVMLHGVLSAGDLQSKLRTAHPNVVVRPRDLADEPFEVWYVYREGHWIGSESHGET
jgi:hypothetical protein